MIPYLAIFKTRLSALLQYRAVAFAGICTQIFWGILNVMILKAFFSQTSVAQPISIEQAATFIWIGQALLQLLPWNIDREIEAQVRTGNVAYELVRPLELYGFWFARTLAMRIVPMLLRAVPLFIIAGLFLDLDVPASPLAGALFCLSIIGAALLSASITTLAMISLFWTVSGDGILRLLPHVVTLFSGMIVPLPLFPAWTQTFISLQPFRGVIDIPSRLYTGVIPAEEAPYYVAFQLVWAFIIALLGKWCLRRALNKLVIQGG